MHDVGVPLDGVELFHLHRPEGRDLSEVVAPEVHEHVVLRQFLFVRQEVLLQGEVLRLRLPSRPGPGEGERVEDTALQLNEGLGGGTGHFDVRPGEVEHVRGRVQGPQDAVGVQEASLEGRFEAVRQDHLEDVPFIDVLLRGPHHLTVAVFVEEGAYIAKESAARFLLLLSVLQEVRQLLQLEFGLVVPGVRVLEGHVADEDDLLSEVVEGDDLVEEHEVHVLELLAVLDVHADFRFAVAEEVVGEVPDEAAGEGREVVERRAPVVGEDLPDVRRRVLGLHVDVPDLHVSPAAGDLQLRVEPEECVPAPLRAVLHTLEHVAVVRDILQFLHDLDGCAEVGEDLAAHREHFVCAFSGDAPRLL